MLAVADQWWLESCLGIINVSTQDSEFWRHSDCLDLLHKQLSGCFENFQNRHKIHHKQTFKSISEARYHVENERIEMNRNENQNSFYFEV